MLPPNTIAIKSDGNVLDFVTMVKTGVNGIKLPEPLYLYKYSKSITKKGIELRLSERQLQELIKNNE